MLELKDKAPTVMALGGALTVDLPGADDVIEAPATAPSSVSKPAPRTSAGTTADALSALINLGYSQGEAAAAVAEAAGANEGAEASALIRAALKLLAPKG